MDKLRTKAKQVANKMLGVEKMDSLEDAVKAAKHKKTNSLGACWAYLIYNSKLVISFQWKESPNSQPQGGRFQRPGGKDFCCPEKNRCQVSR